MSITLLFTERYELPTCFQISIMIAKDKESGPISHYILKHDFEQNHLSYNMDRSKSFGILHPHSGIAEYMTQTETILLKKVKYDCIEDNSLKFEDCINEFIEEELNCHVPWAKQTKFNECETETELESFRNLSFYMTSHEIEDRITKKGCFKTNCKTMSWVKNQFFSTFDVSSGTKFSLSIPFTSTVLVKKEILLADFSTFVADCGSYLGLFLGASVLSITDIIILFVKRGFEKLVAKTCPA